MIIVYGSEFTQLLLASPEMKDSFYACVCVRACAHAGRAGSSVCAGSAVGAFVLRELGERASLGRSKAVVTCSLTHSADVHFR